MFHLGWVSKGVALLQQYKCITIGFLRWFLKVQYIGKPQVFTSIPIIKWPLSYLTVKGVYTSVYILIT